MRFPMPRLVQLDLDGTLVDTIPDLAYSVDAMLQRLALPTRGEANVRGWVGGGVEWLVRRALSGDMDGEVDPELLDRALPVFLDIYAEHTCDRSRVYPGVLEGLDWMAERGIALACVTNKAGRFTRKILHDLGLHGRFRVIVSGDTLPYKKPDPLPMLYALREVGAGPGETLVVGDSITDVEAARAAGLPIVCVSYGYNHGLDIRMAGPDAVVDSLDELPALLGDH